MLIRTERRLFKVVAIFSIAVLFSLNMVAQSGGPYEIKSSVIGGGGGSSSGGTFSIDGTIGQAAAGGPATGSPYSVNSGFWVPGIAGWNLDGEIIYGTNAAKRVPRVNLGLTGSSAGSIMSNLSGVYQLSGLFDGGSYTITPTKTGGQDVSNITSGDSTLTLRQVAAGPAGTLTPNQIIAADANANGLLTAGDATLILRHVAAGGQTVSTGQVGNWRFVPANRTYNGLSGNASAQNFEAILVGEVSGGWTQPLSLSDGPAEEVKPTDRSVDTSPTISTVSYAKQTTQTDSVAGVTVSLPPATGGNGFAVTIPVTLGNAAKAVDSYSFAVFFNPAVLQPIGVGDASGHDKTGTLSQPFTVIGNSTTPGRLGIAATSGGGAPILTSGTLINLRFTVIGIPPATTALTFGSVIFEDPNIDPIAAVPNNGSFTVTAPSASSALVSGRVLTADGRPIRRALVSLISPNGETKTVSTGVMGNFRFMDIAAGQTYILSVLSKSHTFAVNSQVISVSEDTGGILFVSDPPDQK